MAERITTWREQVRDILPGVTSRLVDVCEIGVLDYAEHGASARELAHLAVRTINDNDRLLRSGDPHEYNSECVFVAQAAVDGAMHLPELPAACVDVLAVVSGLVDQISTIADEASPLPEAPPLPGPDREESSGPTDENDFPGEERCEIARRGATFIARIVDHFKETGRAGTIGDLDAIAQAASVIMSAMADEIEGVASLEERLEAALNEASVILLDQSPRSSGLPLDLLTDGKFILRSQPMEAHHG
jgi:hypothetical protein